MHLLFLSPTGWLDILVIAILIYIVLRLLFETRSLSVAIGIAALALVYWFSTALNLPLTHLLLKSFFGFLVVIIAIIFQKELRRLFSFVGFFSFARPAPPAEATIAIVSQAVARLSKGKVGALIVFPGRESISRYYEGGIALHGKISEELLLSIFNEETPGHDGAVVIESNEVRRFGVHLPLAEEAGSGSMKFGGLRHRAALGLSERSDAFVVVVSGESGSVDVARNGKWEHCATEVELSDKLAAYAAAVMPNEGRGYLADWARRNAILFIVSLAIAFATWLVFSPDFAPTQRNFVVPLQFENVPAGYVVQDDVPREVVVTLQGQGSDFETLSPQSLDVSLDLKSITSTGWIAAPVTAAAVDKPINFSVVQVRPQSVQVEMVKGGK